VIRVVLATHDGGNFDARLGAALPKLLGSDDTVIGGVALFRLRFYADGTLASPSPGHLAHAATHVRQQRAAGLDSGPFKTLRTLWWWITQHGPMEAEADLAAMALRDHPVYLAEWHRLRAFVRRA
jgi:hypothetical protein